MTEFSNKERSTSLSSIQWRPEIEILLNEENIFESEARRSAEPVRFNLDVLLSRAAPLLSNHEIAELNRGRFADALGMESVSGNAGRNCAAVNGYVFPTDGRLAEFSNYGPSTEGLVHVTFRVDCKQKLIVTFYSEDELPVESFRNILSAIYLANLEWKNRRDTLTLSAQQFSPRDSRPGVENA